MVVTAITFNFKNFTRIYYFVTFITRYQKDRATNVGKKLKFKSKNSAFQSFFGRFLQRYFSE